MWYLQRSEGQSAAQAWTSATIKVLDAGLNIVFVWIVLQIMLSNVGA